MPARVQHGKAVLFFPPQSYRNSLLHSNGNPQMSVDFLNTMSQCINKKHKRCSCHAKMSNPVGVVEGFIGDESPPMVTFGNRPYPPSRGREDG